MSTFLQDQVTRSFSYSTDIKLHLSYIYYSVVPAKMYSLYMYMYMMHIRWMMYVGF